MDQVQPHIQDVLDLVEFANGPIDSPRGSVRARMGHPEPFNLRYLVLPDVKMEPGKSRQLKVVFPKGGFNLNWLEFR